MFSLSGTENETGVSSGSARSGAEKDGCEHFLENRASYFLKANYFERSWLTE